MDRRDQFENPLLEACLLMLVHGHIQNQGLYHQQRVFFEVD